MDTCNKCGMSLTRDEIGLYRKLVNRGSTQFCCINCLAEQFHVESSELEKMIERFRNQGCMLFR